MVMASKDDREYFRRRAASAKEMADGATDPSVSKIHRVMAKSYEARASEDVGDPIQAL
jgi:hypothetical protein